MFRQMRRVALATDTAIMRDSVRTKVFVVFSLLAGVIACSGQNSQQSKQPPPIQTAKTPASSADASTKPSATETRRQPQYTDADWIKAADAIVRLHPRDFPELPSRIVGELERRQCTIPQIVGPGPHNVIKGQFTKARQIDWAVLCSREGSSAILVFPNAGIRDVVTLAPAEDEHFLQGMGGSSIAYSRQIGVANADFIRTMNDEFGHVTLPKLDHHGINDAFIGKASTVHFWDGKKWLQLAGMD